MSIVLLIVGLALLVVGGDALVRGAIAVARNLHIPPIVIGLTVVAFGTSAPELVVSVDAALRNAPGISVGSIVGSNINNILLVLGVPALFTPIILAEIGVKRSTVFMIGTGVLFYWFALDGTLDRTDGLILFGLLIAYLGYSAHVARRTRAVRMSEGALEDIANTPRDSLRIVGLIVLGSLGLAIGGKLTTEGALGIARLLGVAETAVGLTIVALGTSLPELAASVSASLRREAGVTIGNVVGSNIFNTLGVLGVTALLTPIAVPTMIMHFDFWVMAATFLVLVPFAFKTRKIGRLAAFFMVGGYFTYAFFVFNGYAA